MAQCEINQNFSNQEGREYALPFAESTTVMLYLSDAFANFRTLLLQCLQCLTRMQIS